MFLYTGAYTEPGMGRATGIGLLGFDPATGLIGPPAETTEARNPSYLTMSADGTRLYAVDERESGGVVAFRRNPDTGTLDQMNRQPTGGAHPCYLSLDHSGRYLLVVNYSGGNVSVFPLAADGSIEPASQVLGHEGKSVNPDRQAGPHPHMVLPAPHGEFVYVSDLGLDQVIRYRFDSHGGALTEPLATDFPPGIGPRHFAFGPGGETMVVIGELDSTLVSCAIGEDGALTPVASVSTLPSGFTGNSTCAHVQFSPDGRFVYGSNRGHDSIAVAAFDLLTRQLEIVEIVPTGGREPRNFAIDPSGNWLLAANQHSDTITVFRRDADSGRLTPTALEIDSPTPVALLFAVA